MEVGSLVRQGVVCSVVYMFSVRCNRYVRMMLERCAAAVDDDSM